MAISMSSVVLHVGISVVLLTSMFIFIPAISPSLFSVWCYLDSQSSGSCLYIAFIMLSLIINRLHSNH